MKKIIAVIILLVLGISIIGVAYYLNNKNISSSNNKWNLIYGNKFETEQYNTLRRVDEYNYNYVYIILDNIKYKYTFLSPSNVSLDAMGTYEEIRTGNGLSLRTSVEKKLNLNNWIEEKYKLLNDNYNDVLIERKKINNNLFALLFKYQKENVYTENLVIFSNVGDNYVVFDYLLQQQKFLESEINSYIKNFSIEKVEDLEMCKLDNNYNCTFDFSELNDLNKKVILNIDSTKYKYISDDINSHNKMHFQLINDDSEYKTNIYISLVYNRNQNIKDAVNDFYSKAFINNEVNVNNQSLIKYTLNNNKSLVEQKAIYLVPINENFGIVINVSALDISQSDEIIKDFLNFDVQ